MPANKVELAKWGAMFVRLDLGILEANLGRLSGADFRVWLAMSRYVDHAGRCFPSVSRIAADINVKRRMVQRSIRRLENIGLVRTEQGGGRHRPNEYVMSHFTYGKNKNSDRLDAVLTPTKGDNSGTKGDILVPETAANLTPELESVARAREPDPIDDFLKNFKNRPPSGHQNLPAFPVEQASNHPSRKEFVF